MNDKIMGIIYLILGILIMWYGSLPYGSSVISYG